MSDPKVHATDGSRQDLELMISRCEFKITFYSKYHIYYPKHHLLHELQSNGHVLVTKLFVEQQLSLD